MYICWRNEIFWILLAWFPWYSQSDDEDEGESTSGSPEPLASTEPHVTHGRPSAPQPHIVTQDGLNDLFRDLELSKSKAELHGSRHNNGNFSRIMSEILRFAVVIRSWCLLHKGRWHCVLLRCRWPDECPWNQTWRASKATIYRVYESESKDGFAA